MRSRWLAWVGCLTMILGCAQVAAQPAPKPFKVLDATHYLHTPDLRGAGLEPMYIAYEQSLFAQGDRARRAPDAMPTADKFDAQIFAAKRAGSRFLVIDIEVWSVHGVRKYPQMVAENTRRFEQSVALARSRSKDLRIGLFGPMPLYSPYEQLIAPEGSEAHQIMVEDNDNLSRLALMVDAMFPIGYTITSDRAEWDRAVTRHVSEARRLNRNVPVYVFLWPQYADYRPTPEALKHKPVPADYWRYQLDRVYEIADGVVIWGGWDLEQKKRRTWDEQASWWQATREFMREKGLNKRSNAPVLHR